MKTLVSTVVLLLLCSVSFSQEKMKTVGEVKDVSNSLFTYFCEMGDGEIPEIVVNTDLSNLIKNKLKEEYQPATYTLTAKNGEEATFTGRLRARGNVRKEVCYYPPIKMKFAKADLKKMGYDKHNDLKLVLQCKTKSVGESYLYKEYLAYKLYQLIDPFHVKTKVIKLKFVGGKKDTELYAFLVEEEEEYGDRTGAIVVEGGKLRSSAFERESYLKMVFFQYMIANVDWAVPNKHNLEIVKLPGQKRVVPIAYDFDYSGLVGTDYSIPHESLPISSVKERYFMGKMVTSAEAQKMCDYYKGLKPEIMSTIKSYSYMGEKELNNVTKFIEGFFKELDNPKSIKRTFATADK